MGTETSELQAAFRLAREQCVESFTEWVSTAASKPYTTKCNAKRQMQFTPLHLLVGLVDLCHYSCNDKNVLKAKLLKTKVQLSVIGIKELI